MKYLSSAPQKIYNLIILDESGSMDMIRSATIDSFNGLVATIRDAETTGNQEQRAQQQYLSLYSFNTSGTRGSCFHAPIHQVNLLNETTYRPTGGTPLFDAMGLALLKHETSIAYDPNAATLVTILTDGEENSSVEFTREMIKALVERLMKKGWIFTYIGADHDVSSFATGISIKSAATFHKSAAGLQSMMLMEKRSRLRIYDNMRNDKFDMEIENENYFSEKPAKGEAEEK